MCCPSVAAMPWLIVVSTRFYSPHPRHANWTVQYRGFSVVAATAAWDFWADGLIGRRWRWLWCEPLHIRAAGA